MKITTNMNRLHVANSKKILKNIFNKETLKNRIPITKWLPYYNVSMLVQDALAGAAVGATAVAQGIAYAALAGLPSEYGLYSGIMGGFVYTIFGNCSTMSIGPTSIISALTAKYVHGLSIDFAVLAAFLTGVVQLALGVFQLGFLVDFISGPVITGFVSGAALQIMTSQLKSLLGTDGGAGNSFVESIRNFTVNIRSIRPTDAALGVSTILVLILIKKLAVGCTREDKLIKRLLWYVSLARNVIVVIAGIIIAYVCHLTLGHDATFKLIGDINGGLPSVQLPPVTTTVGNMTYSLGDMLTILGPQSLVLPFVAILEVVVIAKAFTQDARFDSTQEIIALGLCNILGSLVGSMPVTAAMSRSALFQASGVQSPLAGVVVSLVIILSLSVLTSLFYFIPKAVLAGLIIVAVVSLIHLDDMKHLWRSSKREFCVMSITLVACLTIGLEYGVIIGVLIEICVVLFRSARPRIEINSTVIATRHVLQIMLPENVTYCSGEFIRSFISRKVLEYDEVALIVVDGTNMRNMDTTAAFNIMEVVQRINKNIHIVFFNFKPEVKKKCLILNSKFESKFVAAVSLDKLIVNSFELAYI